MNFRRLFMEEQESILLKLEANVAVNYAMAENGFPLLRGITIRNSSGSDIEETVLHIVFQDNFAKEYVKEIPFLPNGKEIDLGTPSIEMDIRNIFSITEKVTRTVEARLMKGDREIAGASVSIQMLPFNQWPGLGVMPELTAAFATPNHPAIDKVIVRASDILLESGKEPSFEGYQSKNPERVLEQASAIYGALRELLIVYAGPPASFETEGQRVRLSDAVLSDKIGTCLDLALLYSSCLEAVSLNPLIVFTEGHAMTGLWLAEEFFPDPVQEDSAALTKRTAKGVNQLAVIEAIGIRQGSTMDFSEAVRTGQKKLSEEGKFILSVDIARSRAGGIRPLPQAFSPDGSVILRETTLKERAMVDPNLINVIRLDEKATQKVQTRREKWERKLLDLSLRNNLLNYRQGKSGMAILSTDLTSLENEIFSGKEFQILKKPDDMENSGSLESINLSPSMKELIDSEFRQGKLRTLLTEEELPDRLSGLFRTARTAIEESGANSLFLVFGRLKWFESPASQKERYAPLVLVPVDLHRKLGKKGYVLKAREEDAVFNITLAELLNKDFSITLQGLDPIPDDGSGCDLTRIFSIVRSAIMNEKRWDVLEDSHLGIFSFRKFIMWNDLKNHGEELGKNRIVKSLMEGSLQFVPEGIEIDGELLDDVIDPAELMFPVSADASQMLAVKAASEGKSFVLHGPPGTGKSQTITNIIANALYDGKRVLFVAEKMAALSVVQKRLQKLGLDPFSLELHSNKAKKRDVLDQLARTISVRNGKGSDEFLRISREVTREREELNEIVRAMYRKHGFSLSAYEMVSAIGILCDEKEMSKIGLPYESLGKEDLEKLILIARDLESCAMENGDYSDAPLKGIGLSAYNPSIKREAADLALRVKDKAANAGDLLDASALGGDLNTYGKVTAIGKMIEIAMRNKSHSDLLSSPALSEMPALITAALEALETAKAKGAEASGYFTGDLQNFDAEGLLAELTTAESKWFVGRLLGESRVMKAIKAKSKDPASVTAENAILRLQNVTGYKAALAELEVKLEKLRVLGDVVKGIDTSYEELSMFASDAAEFLQASSIANADEETRKKICEGSKSSEGALLGLSEGLKDFHDDYANLERILALELYEIPSGEGNWFQRLFDRLTTYSNNLDSLREWTIYNQVKERAEISGIGALIRDFESSRILGRDAVGSLRRQLYTEALDAALSLEPVLSGYTGRQIGDKITYFKETWDKYEELSKKAIFSKLAANVPDMTKEVSQSSEVGILQRAIRSGGRGVSIRKLFDSIPNLLPRLAPCMLMSPISVAQYLSPSKELFDLIVFDEASQMPTSEAVGAIARGKNVVVVGDPKQLPPTSFFMTQNTDEESYELEDLDNILEDCLALSMPESYLQWHYRSRHESLIAFSNRNYYENRLFTYPSPGALVSKVTSEYVEGSYERGGTKQNRKEAEAVVAEIIRRLSDTELRKLSIGVVTFSSVQQTLIEDLLYEAFAEHPELEVLSAESEEPVFVKNLENVQGDERDVILFSVGYGPDEKGKLTMNFGPLNQEGGWRRLNVAVSRARAEMKVFTGIRPEMIDPSKTTAKGVSDLKAFLEYAIRGSQALPFSEAERLKGRDGLQTVLKTSLEKKGLNAVTDVGVSRFRIDLGVVHPERPDEFILGIRCGGDSFREARTARDRDILQDSVLRGLGWNITRVYPMDWYENSEKETERILSLVNELVSGSSPKEEPKMVSEQKIMSFDGAVSDSTDEKKTGIKRSYEFARLAQKSLSSEEFQMPKNRRKIRDDIANIIEIEAPVSEGYLFRRILTAYGLRNGVKNIAIMDALVTDLGYHVADEGGELFIWKDKNHTETVDYYRTDEGDMSREAKEIPLAEVVAAVRETVEKNVSIPSEELPKEVARAFGFQRTSQNLTDKVKAAETICITAGNIRTDETGKVSPVRT
jgi:hypothetical protein